MHNVDRSVLSTSDIFNQAHYQAVGLGRVYDDGRDLGLTEHPEGFKPALPADQIIPGWAYTLPLANGDGPLQPDRLNVVDNFAMRSSISRSRIDDVDPGDRNHLHPLVARSSHHAASATVTGSRDW
jgi:hypothetical protein